MKKYGLIGKSLKHSFSQHYFSEKFLNEKLSDCQYENFELASIDDLPALVESIPDLLGLNVTIPYKQDILPFLKHRDDIVKKIGACNCIKIIGHQLYGYNTDAPAFQLSLQSKIKKHHQCALVLGSGGASKAVQAALSEMGIDFLVVSRHQEGNEIGYEEIGEKMIREHLLIINTTPVGMFPNTEQDPPLPYEALSPQHLLFDLIYNPEKTKFLQQGEARGAQIINGYEMLQLQAEQSWEIWNAE